MSHGKRWRQGWCPFPPAGGRVGGDGRGARAKAQLGAQATAYNPNGHNPLKFARTPDEAIAALLGPARPGFMEPDAAIEDAYRELQQHQIATLKAMQGALRATLERFSPIAIRARADAGGLLERIVPGARDAVL